MKYIFFTTEMSIGGVAKKLTEEGADVTVAQIEDKKLILTQEELSSEVKPEDSEDKKRRLSMFNGIVSKIDAVEAIKAIKKVDPKEYFVAGDMNCCWSFTEQAEKQGFKGMIATEEDRTYEVARDKAKEIVKKNYPDLNLMECKEFQKAADGIKFLEESEEVWVLKSKGDSGETICPKIDDPELANQELIDILEEDAKPYEENGFMLEQKILNGIEMTPEAVFWDGKLVFTDLDIETKTIGCGEVGPNVGCGTNLIIRTDAEDRINQIAFPAYIHELALKRKGMFIIDCGIIFDLRTNKPYFTEFCFQRFGWDAFPTELMMCESNSDYFEKLVKGENPLKYRFGASTRLFNLNQDDKHCVKEGLTIGYTEEAEHCLFLYDAKKESDKIVSAGYQKDLGVVAGSGDTIREAIDNCYSYSRGVAFNDLYYRSQDDFLSKSYSQAILKRVKYAVEQNLIKNEGILQDLEGKEHKSPLQMLQEFDEKYIATFIDNQELKAKIKEYKLGTKELQKTHKKTKEIIKKQHSEEITKVKSSIQELLKEE